VVVVMMMMTMTMKNDDMLEVDEEVDGVVSVRENSGGGVEHRLRVLVVDSFLAERSVDVAEEVDVGRNVEHEERTAGRDEHQRR